MTTRKSPDHDHADEVFSCSNDGLGLVRTAVRALHPQAGGGHAGLHALLASLAADELCPLDEALDEAANTSRGFGEVKKIGTRLSKAVDALRTIHQGTFYSDATQDVLDAGTTVAAAIELYERARVAFERMRHLDRASLDTESSERMSSEPATSSEPTSQKRQTTKSDEKLALLIGNACTGRYTTRLDGVATDALEQIGDELNVLGFALDPSNHENAYVNPDVMTMLVSTISSRATAIAELVHLAKSGRLTLTDDEPADAGASE